MAYLIGRGLGSRRWRQGRALLLLLLHSLLKFLLKLLRRAVKPRWPMHNRIRLLGLLRLLDIFVRVLPRLRVATRIRRRRIGL